MKKAHFLKSLLFVLFMIAPHAAFATPKLRVLSYESLLGKHGLAPIIEARFKETCKPSPGAACELEFVKVNDLTGLIGKLRQDKRNGVQVSYQMVIGLDQTAYDQAASEGLVANGKAFDESPFAIMVDTLKLAEKDRPKSWKELPLKLASSLLVEDSRTSTPGVGWLKSIFEFKLLDKKEAAKTVKRVFPSWSSAYSAFLQGEGSAVWSYQTSEAYHRCNDKPSGAPPRYQALPLDEGYPQQVEYLARVALPVDAHVKVSIKSMELFEATVLEDALVQEKIYTTQWMFPLNKKAKAPDCYKGLTAIKALSTKEALSNKTIQKWIDEWTL